MPPLPPRMTLDERLSRVDLFADLMKQRLREEDDRDEWDTWTAAQLVPRILENASEVVTALSGNLPPADVERCCANLANYAMIMADVFVRRPEGARCLVSPKSR